MNGSAQPVLDESVHEEDAPGEPETGAAARRRPRAKPDTDPPPPSRNEVVLVGRVAAAPEQRELPSGDVLVTWRLVVDRPPAPRRRDAAAARRPTVDTLECVAFAAGLRRTAGGFSAGDVVTVTGALRRRFWRAGGGVASRYAVEVSSARRLWRPRSQ